MPQAFDAAFPRLRGDEALGRASQADRDEAANVGRYLRTYAIMREFLADSEAEAKALCAHYRDGFDIEALYGMIRAYGFLDSKIGKENDFVKKEPVGLDDAVCLWLSGNGDRPVASDCCVDETARDAFHRDYHFFIVRGGCAAYEADLHERALCALEKDCAPLVDTAEVLGAWAWETETI